MAKSYPFDLTQNQVLPPIHDDTSVPYDLSPSSTRIRAPSAERNAISWVADTMISGSRAELSHSAEARARLRHRKTSSPLMTSAPDGTLMMVPATAANGGGLPPVHTQQQPHRRNRSFSGLNPSSSSHGGGTAVSRRRRRVEAAECVTTINT